MLQKFLIVFWLFLPGLLYGQGRPQLQGVGGQDALPDMQVPGSSPQEKDVQPGIRLWKLDGYGAFKDSVKLDTLQDYSHIYHPAYKHTITSSHLGNYATPYQDHNFFNRNPGNDFYFLQTREAYLLTPQNVQYFNTRTPYTLMDFTQSEHRTRKNETRFNVLHSQNVNPWLNFTFRYDQARSAGQYKNQESKNNFVTLYSSYNKDKLNVHGGFISNSIQNNENGGLTPNANLLREPDTDFLDVNLSEVRSEFGSTYIFATGEYRLGKYVESDEKDDESAAADDAEDEEEKPVSKKFKPFAGVIYSFEYQTHRKSYIDEEDSTNTFFPLTFYGDDYFEDSIRFKKVSNLLQLKHYENPERKTSFGKRAFIGQEFVRATLPDPAVGYHPRIKKFSNVYAGGGIFRQTGNFWTWNFDGRIFFLGRNAGQTELSGVISKPMAFLGDSLATFKVKGKILNLVPDYFQDEFYSKRIQWDQNLGMEQRMVVNGSLNFPRRKFELNANYAIINNFIYNNRDAVPAQFGGQLLILSAYADKDFSFRNLHFRTRVLWQKPSNANIVHLPDFSAFVSTWYRFVISKVLFTQLGADARYNTAFFADAYHPATGMFYLQSEQKTGNFPIIDVYANLRLKRTNIFFKMMNVGTEFIKEEYYTAPGYPLNRMTFRLGVKWAFYD